MRSTKFVAVLAAMVMSIGLMLVTSTGGAEAAKKPSHNLIAKGKEIGSTDKFKLFGKVSTFKGRKIIIQRKVNSGKYRFWKKIKTTKAKGRFSTRIYGGKRGSKICYKVVVPKTKKYRVTRDVVGCITTF